MCLTLEWFEQRDERQAEWDTKGVSPEEAERALFMYSSSVWPVAVEMAEWIYNNWSFKDIFKLSLHSRETLLRIVEKEVVAKDSR